MWIVWNCESYCFIFCLSNLWTLAWKFQWSPSLECFAVPNALSVYLSVCMVMKSFLDTHILSSQGPKFSTVWNTSCWFGSSWDRWPTSDLEGPSASLLYSPPAGTSPAPWPWQQQDWHGDSTSQPEFSFRPRLTAPVSCLLTYSFSLDVVTITINPDWCGVIPHCSFDLHFSNNEWCWPSFHVFIGHLYVCLLWRNVCLGLLILIGLSGGIFLYLLSCISCLHILEIN